MKLKILFLLLLSFSVNADIKKKAIVEYDCTKLIGEWKGTNKSVNPETSENTITFWKITNYPDWSFKTELTEIVNGKTETYLSTGTYECKGDVMYVIDSEESTEKYRILELTENLFVYQLISSTEAELIFQEKRIK